MTGPRDGFPTSGQHPPLPTQEQEIESVNAREELLLRARGLARRIRERVWKAMGEEGLQGPHGRAGSGSKRLEQP